MSVQMTCLSAYMYRQIPNVPADKSPKRHYWGGGGAIAPPAPPLATLMKDIDVGTKQQGERKSVYVVCFLINMFIYFDIFTA